MVRGSFYGSPSSSLTLIHCWRHWRKKLGCHHFRIHLLGVKVFDVTMSVSTSWCWEGNLRGLTKICSTDPRRTMNVKKKSETSRQSKHFLKYFSLSKYGGWNPPLCCRLKIAEELVLQPTKLQHRCFVAIMCDQNLLSAAVKSFHIYIILLLLKCSRE